MKNVINLHPCNYTQIDCNYQGKTLNYKHAVESIELDEQQSLNDDIYPCNCKNSELCDPGQFHIVTGNLSHIKNQKLRRHFTKGPNFREPQSLNYSRCKKDVDWAMQESSRNLRLKHNLENAATDLSVNKVK